MNILYKQVEVDFEGKLIASGIYAYGPILILFNDILRKVRIIEIDEQQECIRSEYLEHNVILHIKRMRSIRKLANKVLDTRMMYVIVFMIYVILALICELYHIYL